MLNNRRKFIKYISYLFFFSDSISFASANKIKTVKIKNHTLFLHIND